MDIKMQVGLPYIVTKGTPCGTYQVGDHLCLYENGSVGCREAHGWQEKEDHAELVKAGLEVEVDRQSLERRIARLNEQLAACK